MGTVDIFKAILKYYKSEDFKDLTPIIEGGPWFQVQFYPGTNIIRLEPYHPDSEPTGLIGSFKCNPKLKDVIEITCPADMYKHGFIVEVGDPNIQVLRDLFNDEWCRPSILVCDYSILTNETPKPIPTFEELYGKTKV